MRPFISEKLQKNLEDKLPHVKSIPDKIKTLLKHYHPEYEDKVLELHINFEQKKNSPEIQTIINNSETQRKLQVLQETNKVYNKLLKFENANKVTNEILRFSSFLDAYTTSSHFINLNIKVKLSKQDSYIYLEILDQPGIFASLEI
jgi:hypothetical protein